MSENMSSMGGSSSSASSAAESARTGYAHARDAARQAMGAVRERASEYYEQGKSKAVDYTHRVEDMVREQPMKSVLIAAGAGLVLGMLLRRR